jgi:hypothetical protein
MAEQLVTFAMFRWAYQSPIKRALSYQSHDYCNEVWSAKTSLSDKQITSFLKYVGENRELAVQWMKYLLPETKENGEKFVMMDSTHVMSASENISVNASGYNPSFDFGRQIRLMYIFSAELKKPVYYRLINGNITDISSMSLCVKEMGVKNVVFIADKGFYSKANTALLHGQGLQYLIPLRRNNPKIDYSPLSAVDYKKGLKYFVYQKRIIWYYQYAIGPENFITFLDERLRVDEEQDYLQRITARPDGYSEEHYFEKLNTFGTLTLGFNIKALFHKSGHTFN